MLRRCAALILFYVHNVQAGGDAKLWELGNDVEKNPRTVFTLFTLTVFLTMLIEFLKHKAEHATHGTHRGQALGAIFSELMMIGVVSFLLIVAAELGLTDVRIRKPGCDDLVPGNDSDSSGSIDENHCYFTFDLLMFEYAHLVLFFMGLSYGLFIQICFMQRNRYVKEVLKAQNRSLNSVSAPEYKRPGLLSIMGFGGSRDWARALLVLRSAVVIQHRELLKEVCDPAEVRLEATLAMVKGEKPPLSRPAMNHALRAFDLGRFTHIAVAEVLVHLLHVPVVVWFAVIALSSINLVHEAGMGLALTVLIFCLFGPIFSIGLLFRMASQLRQVVTKAAGHPEIADHLFSTPVGVEDSMKVPQKYAHDGIEWAEGKAGPPWEVLTGCCEDDHPLNFLDLNDPTALEKQMQIVVFGSCFMLGQIVMLGDLIGKELGVWAILLCYIITAFPLVFVIPRAILLYTLIHKTEEAERSWLVHAVEQKDVGVDLPDTKDAAYNDLEKFLSQRNHDHAGDFMDSVNYPTKRIEGNAEGSLPPTPAVGPREMSPSPWQDASTSFYDMNQTGGHHPHHTQGSFVQLDADERSINSFHSARRTPGLSPTYRSVPGHFPGRVAPPKVRRASGQNGTPTEEDCAEVYDMINRSISEHDMPRAVGGGGSRAWSRMGSKRGVTYRPDDEETASDALSALHSESMPLASEMEGSFLRPTESDPDGFVKDKTHFVNVPRRQIGRKRGVGDNPLSYA